MNQKQVSRNSAFGLSLFAQLERVRYFKEYVDCNPYREVHDEYPFETRDKVETGNRRIYFVGAHAMDMSVEAFIVHLREYLGYSSERLPQKFRIISAPYRKYDGKDKNVFFEVWFDTVIIISGDTDTFTGPGNEARNDLENVFCFLNIIFAVPIERVELSDPVDIIRLYTREFTVTRN